MIFARLGLAPARDGDDFVVTPPSLSLRPCDRRRPDRRGRAPVRLRQNRDARRCACAAHAARTGNRATGSGDTRSHGRSRLPGSHHLQLRQFGLGAQPGIDAAHPIAVLNPDRQPSRCDAHDAARWSASTCCEPTSTARPNGYASSRLGRCFRRDGETLEQPLRIAGLAFGPVRGPNWDERQARAVDFFDVKGDVEALAWPLNGHHPRGVASGPSPGSLGAGAHRSHTRLAGSANCTRGSPAPSSCAHAPVGIRAGPRPSAEPAHAQRSPHFPAADRPPGPRRSGRRTACPHRTFWTLWRR